LFGLGLVDVNEVVLALRSEAFVFFVFIRKLSMIRDPCLAQSKATESDIKRVLKLEYNNHIYTDSDFSIDDNIHVYLHFVIAHSQSQQ
jgi:hypothetical protein